MAANKPGKAEILAAFFDDGTYSPLFTDGAVSAAYGCANGQNAYVVFEDGSPVGVQDIEKNIRVLEMAAETGAPVVTFYDSTGAKLEGGLDLLNANARLTAEIARVSGVVPQVAVVTGTCAGTNAINAAAADVCVMAEDAELFLNAPFNAEDKVANAGSPRLPRQGRCRRRYRCGRRCRRQAGCLHRRPAARQQSGRSCAVRLCRSLQSS